MKSLSNMETIDYMYGILFPVIYDLNYTFFLDNGWQQMGSKKKRSNIFLL